MTNGITYEAFRTVFMVSVALSVLMLLISVLLFLVFDIPNVIGELTGTNAKKGIAQIRDRIGKSGTSHRTGEISQSVSSASADSSSNKGSQEKYITEKIISKRVPDNGEETTTLENYDKYATTILSEKQTAFQDVNLEAKPNSTGNSNVIFPSNQKENVVPEFLIEYEITYIHTDEILES